MDPPVEHLVALKVMRLTRPTITSPLIVTCDVKDLPGNAFINELKQDVTAVQGLETIGCGQFLLLPQSFGNIYLGEIFSSYICVYNETNQVVNNVSIKAYLQTTNQRVTLSANRTVEELGPDDTVNDVIHHELKEIGTHILVCEVTYLSKTNESSSFRKFFKFQVLKPLDVKTKFYNTDSDKVYLEAQVLNITAGPICLEKVSFDANPSFSVQSLNMLENGESVFGNTNILDPQACCQFLYCMQSVENQSSNSKLLSGPTNIGKLDIVWRSNIGEIGRLQTSQLQTIGNESRDIKLVVKNIPSSVLLEKKFKITCTIVNSSERKIELNLDLVGNISKGLVWSDNIEYKLNLEANGSIDIVIGIIPIKSGLLNIGGIRLTDLLAKRTYEFDKIAQVLVIRNGTEKHVQLLNK